MGYLEDTASQLIANGTLPQPDGSFSLFELSSVVVLSVTLISFILPVLIIYPPVPATESDALNVTHSRLGPHLRGAQPKARSEKPGSSVPRVRSLWIYPVKSCAGIQLSQSKVLPTGLQHDRMFMFGQLRSPFPVSVDASDKDKNHHTWEMATMRQFPRMANVSVDIWVPDEGKLRGRLRPEDRPTESYVVIRFPWRDGGWWGLLQAIGAKLKDGLSSEPFREILLPLKYPSDEDIEAKKYEFAQVKVWKDTVRALNLQPEIPPELQRYLGVSNKLSLFRLEPGTTREVFRNAPTKEDAGYQPIVSFQDAYPLNILNLESVRALEEKMEKDETIQRLDPRRFRANIIFEGNPPYDEETWKLIHIAPDGSGDVTGASFDVCCRCVRCTLPNVDPDTGIRHRSEPNRCIKKFRDVDAGAPNHGCMAMNLVPLFGKETHSSNMEGWLEVGMPIHIASRGEHVYKSMFDSSQKI